MKTKFPLLLQEVNACHLCPSVLSLGPRPVLQLHPKASILIAGQAPGRHVHETGIPLMIGVKIDFGNGCASIKTPFMMQPNCHPPHGIVLSRDRKI